MSPVQHNWSVIAISGAGVAFILLGLLALALPPAQEGIRLWQLDHQHAVYQMDVAGSFALGLGMALTWLGGKLWNRQLLS
jgi:cytochrome c biogenesis protein CcdA